MGISASSRVFSSVMDALLSFLLDVFKQQSDLSSSIEFRMCFIQVSYVSGSIKILSEFENLLSTPFAPRGLFDIVSLHSDCVLSPDEPIPTR